MCFEPTARPPLPPIRGGAGVEATGDVVLRAADGNRFLAHAAVTAEPGAPGVVILPDVRGLHPFYQDLSERFAQAGVHATALDYFGRTAGTEERDDDFPFMEHVQQTSPDGVAADTAAAVAHLRSPAGGGTERVYTVGFCFGGRHSFNQAARGHGLHGVIGFYGVPQKRSPEDTNAPVVLASTYACKVLGLFGGEDLGITQEHVDAFGRALDEAKVENTLVTYENSPHSFFDRSFAEHKEACDDAWRRMLAFVGRPG
jgi:carboxymethylenebutenolidase